MNFSIFESDPTDPRDRLADYIMASDEKLFRDLVAFRKMRGMSQQDVAERMGIDKSNVSRLESAVHDVQLSTLRRYAMAIDAVVRHDVLAFDVVDAGAKSRTYSDRTGAMTRVAPEVVHQSSSEVLTYV